MIISGIVEDKEKEEKTKEDILSFLVDIKMISKDKFQPQQKNTQAHTPSYKKKILVVDDEADIRDFFKIVVEKEGFQFLQAGDGKDALKVMGEHPDIALIYIDLKLPRMNGISLLKMMRSMKMMEWANILIVTGVSNQEVLNSIKQFKINGLLTKPVDQKTISASIQKFVPGHHATS